MPTRDLDIYLKRWEALDGLIRSAIAFYGRGNLAFSRQSTIVALLEDLRGFATGQFMFFYNGFEPRVAGRN